MKNWLSKALLLAFIAAPLLSVAPAAWAQQPQPGSIPLAQSLASDSKLAKSLKKPIVILFSRSDCGFCHQVRTGYLRHIPQNPKSEEMTAILREVVSDYNQKIQLPDGKTYTAQELIKRYDIKFYPTVIALNSDLQRVGEPIVGFNSAGFYGAYLDSLIEQASKTR